MSLRSLSFSFSELLLILQTMAVFGRSMAIVNSKGERTSDRGLFVTYNVYLILQLTSKTKTFDVVSLFSSAQISCHSFKLT